MLVFACLSPHPPIILPNVGSAEDRVQVKKTIASLEKLAKQLAQTKPDCIVISSPHPDWGIKVPLHFLMSNFKCQISNQFQMTNFENWKLAFRRNLAKRAIGNSEVLPILTTLDSPQQHFEWGKKIAKMVPQKLRWAWIASGDMSHRLAEDGPYGLHPSGPKFDKEFIRLLKQKDIQGILNLSPRLTEEAGECGLRSFCMLLGALEAHSASSGQAWQPEILSYEGPFGIGYLVARLL